MSTETQTPDQAPAVSDLPSGEPIKSVPPPPAPRPKSKSTALSPTSIDAFVAHVSRCFSTPSGIDTVLCFLCYTSRFSASAVESLTATALRRSARRLVALAFSLPPDATLSLSAKPSRSPSAALALRSAGHLRALATLLSEARTIMRLWALLPMYLWLRRLMTTKPAPESSSQTQSDAVVDRAISWFQVTACILLQSLESASYLASKGVLPLTPRQSGLAARWSVRFWSCYVGSELGRLLVEKLRRRRQLREGAIEMRSGEYREWQDVWTRTLARQAAWFPLTVHWSMDKGFVPEMGIGFLGSIPGIVQMRQLWKETAAA
ncbi:hypothetical protein C8035_v008192 [Colletotrichum spinosum]|uniref:Peroxin 11C n=1 Tax=Colletotrichum spinosum TaxID=1347390 RepID=A0A4R8QJ17_9PEZI|nr:hypothetical protein C8035_v008192 [Colletotrichum spinosum]